MLAIHLPKSFYYYLNKSQFLVDLSKKILIRNNYIKNSNYYSAVLNQYVNYGSYLNIFKSTTALSAIQTNIDIQSDILGGDTKAVISKNGKPDFIFNDNKTIIYVYKWKFNGLRTRCEVHFYDNKAFLINYVYSTPTNADKKYITKTVTQKYLEQNIDLQNGKIVDRNNNILFLNDGVEFRVTYLSSNNSHWY